DDDVVDGVVSDVELELEVLVEDVLVDVVDDVEVLVDVLVEVVVLVDVVVGAFGLQTAGNGPNSGTAAASMQSVLNRVMQSTQSTRSCASTIAPPQLDPSNGATFAHVVGNPMLAGVRSPVPSHEPSLPPQALQIASCSFVSAFAMAAS